MFTFIDERYKYLSKSYCTCHLEFMISLLVSIIKVICMIKNCEEVNELIRLLNLMIDKKRRMWRNR
jgi:hypothetical protein